MPSSPSYHLPQLLIGQFDWLRWCGLLLGGLLFWLFLNLLVLLCPVLSSGLLC